MPDLTTAESINLLGRILVAFYFLWAALFNIRAWGFNLSEFQRIGVPYGKVWLPCAIILQTIGSFLFVYTGTVPIGAICLCAFVVAADVLFHRFWTYPKQPDRTMHLQFLMEHVALIGGILGLAASHI